MNTNNHKRDLKYSSDFGYPWEEAEKANVPQSQVRIKRKSFVASKRFFQPLINFFNKNMDKNSIGDFNYHGHDLDIEDNRVIAAIGYVWILCLLPLFFKRHSKFAQFHGRQAALLFLAETFGSLIFWIPLVGWVLFVIIIGLAIAGLLNAWLGHYWEMPILGKYARKISL